MKRLLLLLGLAASAAFGQPITPINNARITGTSSAATLGIGTGATAVATNLQVIDTGTATPRGITDDQYNNGTNSAQFNLRKARGTFATPLTIVTGDILGREIVWGHDGTNFIETGNLRFTSEGTIAATRVPSKFEIFVGTDAAPTVLTSTASFSGSSGISLTALGATSSITLTPSGTGGVILGNNNTGTVLAEVRATGSTPFNLAITRTDIASTGFRFYISAGPDLRIRNNGGSDLWTFTNTGHLLLGGLTTDGTGVLQFPAATTTAGGIVFGTDVAFYRTGTNDLGIGNIGGSPSKLRFYADGVAKGIATPGGSTFSFGSTGTNAFNLQYNETSVIQLNSATQATVLSTNTLKFGATAAATIGVSADASGSLFQFTHSTNGSMTVQPVSGVTSFVVTNPTSNSTSQIFVENTGGTAQSWSLNMTGSAGSNPQDLLVRDQTSASNFMQFFHGASGAIRTLNSRSFQTSRLVPQVTSTATAAGTTTLTTSSTMVQIFTGSTTQSVTLPAANLDGAGFGTSYDIKNRSSGTVTINRAGSDTIDGATSYSLTAGNAIRLISDGVSDWTVQ